MNEDILKGNWLQLKGRVREMWGELTNDEVDQIHGQWERLVGRLHEHYGYTRQEAEDEIDEFLSDYERM